MRLEDDEDAPRAGRRASGYERGGDLAGMVTVVVVDGDPARGAQPLEPPPGAGDVERAGPMLLEELA